MEREEFTFQTEDGVEIQAYYWFDTNISVKGIVQIAHGMVEHALRYEPFIRFLTANGFYVYANDHRGHGQSYKNELDKGFIAKRNGFEKAVHDLTILTNIIQEKHPDTPLFLLGHSFGSFLVRRYIQCYDKNLTGVILSGTGSDPGIIGRLGLMIAKLERFIKGPTRKSPLMDKLIFGNYNKRISPKKTNFDFLTRDETIVDNYITDKRCGFVCTTSFYIDLLEGIQKIHQDNEIAKVNTKLPIFLFAGIEDPVGNYGKGVQEVYEQYLQHNFEEVSIKLYDNGRHEMLNEINRMEVYTDILNWLETIMKGER